MVSLGYSRSTGRCGCCIGLQWPDVAAPKGWNWPRSGATVPMNAKSWTDVGGGSCFGQLFALGESVAKRPTRGLNDNESQGEKMPNFPLETGGTKLCDFILNTFNTIRGNEERIG